MATYNLILALILIVCVLLILVVIVQNSKGGGLASNFSSSNQIMGVRKTADFLEKATWILAGSLLFLSLITAFVIPKNTGTKVKGTSLQEQIDKNGAPSNYQPAPSNAKKK